MNDTGTDSVRQGTNSTTKLRTIVRHLKLPLTAEPTAPEKVDAEALVIATAQFPLGKLNNTSR